MNRKQGVSIRKKITAIVLSYDVHMPFVKLITEKYKQFGWDEFLDYRVPVNEPNGAVLNDYILGNDEVSPVFCGKSIQDTMVALLEGFDDQDWVYWCISDRYPVSLLNADHMRKYVEWLLSDASRDVDILKLFHWRETYTGQSETFEICGDEFFLQQHEGKLWGFWHHHFMRARVLKDIFFKEDLPDNISVINEYMHQKYKDEFPYTAVIPKIDIAKFGESFVRGELTINGIIELQQNKINVPKINMTRRTKGFTNRFIPAVNRYWESESQQLPFVCSVGEETDYFVNSFGGVGSKMLVKALKKIEKEHDVIAVHGHLRFPPEMVSKKTTMIYMFGDPGNSVISFFERRESRHERHGFDGKIKDTPNENWAVQHCRNIECDAYDMSASWQLEEFLENGLDYFRLEEHFDYWFYALRDYDILFVRYETIWENLDVIEEMLNLEEEKFPKKIERRSKRDGYGEHVNDGLDIMYGELTRRFEKLPDVFVIRKGEVVLL